MASLKPLEAARPSITILGGIVLLGVVLSLARAVLIPVFLAILLSFILTPAVVALQRRKVPRTVAVLGVTVTALLVISGGVWAITSQLHEMAREMPSHKENFKRKIREVQGEGPGVMDRLFQMVDEVTAETKPDTGKFAIPVEVIDRKSGIEIVMAMVMPLVGVIGSIGLVIALTVAMLFKREDLRNRLLRLAGQGQLTSTTRAIDDATRRISRYLVLQVSVNAGFGFIYTVGLLIIGVPYALLWGIVAMVVRFVPYIGTWLAMILPLLVSIAVSDGWFQPTAVIVFAVVIGLAVNNALEPLLISRTTGVSPVALVIAAAFWTWLWGPIGLVLSTPVTVCLGVLGRFVPALEFLDVLFGTDPALDPQHGYYQRLLARDEVEAHQVLEDYLQEHNLPQLCDDVLVPVLVRVKEDYGAGQLSDEDVHYIIGTTEELFEARSIVEAAEAEGDKPLPMLVLSCPARDEVDELALRVFQVLAGPKYDVKVLGSKAVAAEILEEVGRVSPTVVLIAAVHPGGLAKIRYLCKRMRGRFPQLPIAVGYWGLPVDEQKLTGQLRAVGANEVATAMSDTAEQLKPFHVVTPDVNAPVVVAQPTDLVDEQVPDSPVAVPVEK